MDKITIERETLKWAIRWHESRIWPGPDEVSVFDALRAALAAQPAETQPTGQSPCARHCEAPAFEGEIRRLKRELQTQAERVRVLEHLVIDAAYTLDKARIWNGMGWTYNPLHPIHYTPMRERLHNECDSIEAARAALDATK